MRCALLRTIYVCLFLAVPVTAQMVNETRSELSIDGDKAIVRLVVGPGENRNVTGDVQLLDTNDKVVASEQRLKLAVGDEKTFVFTLPLAGLSDHEKELLAWYRLRYRIGETSGTVSLSQLIRDLFELRIYASGFLLPGATYRARVRAVNPFTEKPLAGVKVTGTIKVDLEDDDDDNDDNNELKLSSTGETDVDGFAVFEYPIPIKAAVEDASIIVTGQRRGVVRTARDDIDSAEDDVQMIVMSDKPIYQPGQLLSLRGIVMKGMATKTVLGGTEIEFRVTDDDDTLLYREKVVSSEYGVGAFAWKIPTNAKLGTYRIDMRGTDGETIGSHVIKVSRYDLPNFAVTAKPSKPYYLPADKQAEIEVRADYLFGKPVTKGKVRIVRENSREWNWREQKYDIDEGESREGEVDAEGKYLASFDLSKDHDELDGNSWRNFKDINLAAYFTDPTTNKTEQRRFDVRVSREAIHVYLIGENTMGQATLPMQGYVSTFYADGTPAECVVEVQASLDYKNDFRSVGRVKTNKFGAGKINMPRPKIGDPDDDLDFRLVARDANNRTGSHEDEVSFSTSETHLRVTTDRAIYKPGDAMNVRIDSTIKEGPVFVEVVSDWSVIASREVKLRNGRASLNIRYDPRFKGELTIGALAPDPSDADDTIESAAAVIFPAKKGIKIDASFDKAVYKPNDEATVKFGILDVAGKAVESSLGVVVFDKAVEERARTDGDFGGMFPRISDWLGYGKGFGGVNRKDLLDLDLTKPIADEMQLVAELMMRDAVHHQNVFRSEHFYDRAKAIFAGRTSVQMQPVAESLRQVYVQRNFLHPTNDTSLRAILENYGIDFDDMRDPWGSGYVTKFAIDKTRDVLTISSAGPDKTANTADDFVAYSTAFEYFNPMGRAIDAAVASYNARTGSFIRDEKTLFAELGVSELRDRFGGLYRVVTAGEGRYLVSHLRSNGPNGSADDYGDDFDVWTTRTDFFAAIERKIVRHQSKLKSAPANESEFKATLKDIGVDLDAMRDGSGHPLYVTAKKRARYTDKVVMETVRSLGSRDSIQRGTVTPVSQEIFEFTIRSVGSDGKAGSWDDVTLTQVAHVLSEQLVNDRSPVRGVQQISFTGNAGAIIGIVSDPNGAVIPGATVTATNTETQQVRSTLTDDSGRYAIAGLVPGTYSVSIVVPGFMNFLIQNVGVNAGTTTTADATLSPGGVSSTVEVTAGATTIDATSSSIGTNISARQITELSINGARTAMSLIALQPGVAKVGKVDDVSRTNEQTSTPRLREYFPETLHWAPEIVTVNGRAEVKFRMADSITTWKMYTIASTKDGKLGFAEKEVAAFQSFFVDLDPPKFLTTGDEIFLPTQVRNYTEKKQNVKVNMSTADWFAFLDADAKQVAVDSGGSENAIFGFKATKATKEGKQRVTALAETDSDAIERPVTVRPDGREVTRTESRYFTGSDKIVLDFPENALANSNAAEIKIYPNLMAHVAESVEGLLRRPYGCGEQTISSTYPNVMILKFAKPATGQPRRISESVERKAEKFLRSGYDRLLGYQVADGGFSYWGGKDAADFALTAYALRFLADASKFIEVDPQVVTRAESWLINQQRPDGSWNRVHKWETTEDSKRTLSTTTYVARTLAMLRASGVPSSTNKAEALRRALAYLKQHISKVDDPYSLALFGIASVDAGDTAAATAVAQRIAAVAKSEAAGTYWTLESSTAFNGWGNTGRIETTALVTQLFIKLNSHQDLVGKAMTFLIRNKDNYGVWYSTQTTINVLDALLLSLAERDRASASRVDVLVNGRVAETIDIAPDNLGQLVVDLTGKLAPGKNTVEIRTLDRTPMMSQTVATHYLSWDDADASGRTENYSRALRLDYKCDRTSAAIMDEVSCAVEAERVGYQGYGMLLAEIGTPPGADVSRESLKAAMDADWSISRYDVLPDRIVLYMWSKAGGTKFNFKFRPRYGINAKTPASVVYDYYNPEAQATVAPLQFAVK